MVARAAIVKTPWLKTMFGILPLRHDGTRGWKGRLYSPFGHRRLIRKQLTA